jgi:hypothetical protein
MCVCPSFTFKAWNFTNPVYMDMRTGRVYKIDENQYVTSGSEYTFLNVPIYDSPVLISEKSILKLQE